MGGACASGPRAPLVPSPTGGGSMTATGDFIRQAGVRAGATAALPSSPRDPVAGLLAALAQRSER